MSLMYGMNLEDQQDMKKVEFTLLKDVGPYKKGKTFDCFDGLVAGISFNSGEKTETIKFYDTKYFKLKKRYWYRHEIRACVLCGKEEHARYRVYNELEKGTFWYDTACNEHFC